MDSKRKINVGMSSSLIDLKAELLKKQGELQSKRVKQDNARGVAKSAKKSVLAQAKAVDAKKNRGIDKRAQRDLEAVREEENMVLMSHTILEQKAKLYEKMTSEALEHDELEHPVLATSLVNFTQKAIDNIKSNQQEKTTIQPTPIRISYDDFDDNVVEDDYVVDEEEWAEFTDGLGRTRRCLKSELTAFILRDETLARPQNPAGVSLSREAEQSRIEMKRQQWEKDAEATAEKETIHYQDVLYDEVRSHGVGFYGFAKDELARSAQMQELKKLSRETEAIRSTVLKERSEKKTALQERLKKIRDRKRAKLGLPPKEYDSSSEPEEDALNDGKSAKDEDGPSSSKKEALEEEKKMRAWDFGKPGVFGPKPETFDELDAKWLRDRRAERISEFAPPKSLK